VCPKALTYHQKCCRGDVHESGLESWRVCSLRSSQVGGDTHALSSFCDERRESSYFPYLKKASPTASEAGVFAASIAGSRACCLYLVVHGHVYDTTMYQYVNNRRQPHAWYAATARVGISGNSLHNSPERDDYLLSCHVAKNCGRRD
jgi:hypothetical protein